MCTHGNTDRYIEGLVDRFFYGKVFYERKLQKETLFLGQIFSLSQNLGRKNSNRIHFTSAWHFKFRFQT